MKTPPAGLNSDARVVEGFGREWTRFDQGSLSQTEALELFDRYFSIFPWDALPPNATGFDAGCGSGRWARLVAPRVGMLHCIDASEGALRVASTNLVDNGNCRFHLATLDKMPLPDDAMDFGYSLGVLHHIPDTLGALRDCVRKLKVGAPFLLYLYYAFDNRPPWFRMIWRVSDVVRRLVSRAPFRIKSLFCDICALTVYWPLARTARLAVALGVRTDNFPLSAYKNQSVYVMRTDALDRLGTRLEKRFTRDEVRRMMTDAGLSAIEFHEGMPHWVAVGRRQR